MLGFTANPTGWNSTVSEQFLPFYNTSATGTVKTDNAGSYSSSSALAFLKTVGLNNTQGNWIAIQ
jgi:hypothetical protein